MKAVPLTPYVPKKPFGLGDLVEVIAKPVVRVSDARFGTQLKGCKGCASRKDFLNSLAPNLNPFK